MWLGDYKLSNVQVSSISDTGDDWECKEAAAQQELSSYMWGECPRGWLIIKTRLKKKEKEVGKFLFL